jgi:hypothetical protein
MSENLQSEKQKKFDAFFFVAGEDDTVSIEGCNYKDPGEDVEGSSMGKMYHIMLYKEDEEGVYAQDLFEAILVEPLEYIYGLIPQSWYGLIAKKTTTSSDFINETFDKLKAV